MGKGYGKMKGLKIMHWNKGSKFLINKVHDIKSLLEVNKPHILSLSEAQIRKEDMDLLHFEDYNMEVDNLIDTNKMARSCMLIHKDIIYKRNKDIEPYLTSVIVINVGLNKQKKFTVIQWYHQWQLLNNIVENSVSLLAIFWIQKSAIQLATQILHTSTT